MGHLSLALLCYLSSLDPTSSHVRKGSKVRVRLALATKFAMDCETSPSPAFPAGIPKRRLDHDLNSAWGSVLCFGQLQAITTANPLWQEFLVNRLAVESRYNEFLSLYTDSFALVVPLTPPVLAKDVVH